MTQQKTIPCPDSPTLARYLGEELGESDELRVEEHLGDCTACQSRLEEVAGAPDLWSELREHLADAPLTEPADGTQSSELDELTELLGPTDDPRMLGRLGAYEVCGLIGRGTTGIVLKALEPRLNRYVAIKLMSPSYVANGSARWRFEREGRAIAAVSHEHVVPIYAVDEHRGIPYIVMKYVPGLSLEQRLERDGPLDTTEAVRVGLQVAEGLAAAHEQGIVHRDVKPANVILEATVERAMVTDFGLARVTDEASMTRSGTITGTPQYMAPEQARGDGVDERSDLFSLGSLLYAACTGRPPFRAETVYGVINRVCASDPRPIREQNPEIADWLEDLVAKLMAKDPAERFQSAEQVRVALAAELAHLQNPTAATKPARTWRPEPEIGGGRKRRLGLALAGVGALALFGAAWSEWSAPEGESGVVASLLAGFGDGPSMRFGSTEGGGQRLAFSPPGVNGQEAPSWDTVRSQVFPVERAGKLVLRVDDGDVEVVASGSSAVEVSVLRLVDANDPVTAAEFEARHNLQVRQLDNDVTLMSEPRASKPRSEGARRPLYHVAVPPGSRLDLLVTRGTLEVGSLEADVNAETFEGELRLGRVSGSVRARARGGDLWAVEGFDGEANLFAVHGNVMLAGASRGAEIFTSSGHVFLGASTGDVYAQTSGGDVYVLNVDGPTGVHAEEGDVYVVLEDTPRARADFSAARGSVFLEVAESVKATVDARGALETSLPFELAEPTDDWNAARNVARLGGGGPVVRILSTTGRVGVARPQGLQTLGLATEKRGFFATSPGGGRSLPFDLSTTSEATSLFGRAASGSGSNRGRDGASLLFGKTGGGGEDRGLVESGGKSSAGEQRFGLGGSSDDRNFGRGKSSSSEKGFGLGGSSDDRSFGRGKSSAREKGLGSGDSSDDRSFGSGISSSGEKGFGPGAGSTDDRSFGSGKSSGSEKSFGLGGSGSTSPSGGRSSAGGRSGRSSLFFEEGEDELPTELSRALWLARRGLGETEAESRPGRLVSATLDRPFGNVDGYTLYLPEGHDEREGPFPVLVYLQGGLGVGGAVAEQTNWGLLRLLRDERDLGVERNRLLLGEFIVVSPHIVEGNYDDHPDAIEWVLDLVIDQYRGDPDRVAVTGLSRGGHGTWGLGVKLPGRFAALAPIGANTNPVRDPLELAGLPIWIGHNPDDGVTPFQDADLLATDLERMTGVEFLRTSPARLAETDVLERRLVFTSTLGGGHDAWTDLYSSAEFYRWLLSQRREPAGERALEGR